MQASDLGCRWRSRLRLRLRGLLARSWARPGSRPLSPPAWSAQAPDMIELLTLINQLVLKWVALP